MKITLFLKVLVPVIIIGCTRVNRSDVLFEFDNSTRQLNVQLMASALYLTKIDTKIKPDTLELFVYDKPVLFTFNEKNKKASRTIIVDANIHYIQHRDSVYEISILPTPK